MQKRVDVDPLSDLPTEDVTIRGILMHVRGLTYDELTTVTEPCKGNPRAIAVALVEACVTREDGKAIVAGSMRPDVVKTLQEAVARVNGFDAEKNSSATGADDSSTA